MPTLPPAIGVAKVTFHQTYAGRQFGDSVFFRHADNSPWTVAQLNSLALNAAAEYAATVATHQNGGLAMVQVDALDLSDNVGRLGVWLGTVPGTSGLLDPLPLNTVLHVSFLVPRRYRGGKPGYNVSGLDRSDTADQRQWIPSHANTVLVAVTGLISGTITAMGGSGVVTQAAVSYFEHHVLRVTPLVLVPVAAEAQLRLCTLRRRLGKGIAG